MLSEKGIQLHDPGPQSMPLFALHDDSGSIEGFGPNLDGNIRMRHQIVVPVRVSQCASIGGNHEQTITIGDMHHWGCTVLATLSAYSREQEQRPSLEWSISFVPIRAELLNQLAIVVILIGHNLSFLFSLELLCIQMKVFPVSSM
jgi:hypothetical protein